MFRRYFGETLGPKVNKQHKDYKGQKKGVHKGPPKKKTFNGNGNC